MLGMETDPDAGVAEAQRVAAYGICEDATGNVLLVRAASHLTVAGSWFLPGGGIEHGEDPPEGLAREFTEETGLTVVVGNLLGVLSDVFDLPNGINLHTVRIIYRIDSYSGTIRDEVGGSSDTARWVAPREVRRLPLRPYVTRALSELR
jgi:8-oxo-dGTP diphosphatase